MLNKEEFKKIELEHGCGYWKLCWEHACPCAITTENKGLREDIYNSFIEENKQIAEEYDELDDIEIPHYEKCSECGSLEEENDLIDGMCWDCYHDYQDEMEAEHEDL